MAALGAGDLHALLAISRLFCRGDGEFVDARFRLADAITVALFDFAHHFEEADSVGVHRNLKSLCCQHRKSLCGRLLPFRSADAWGLRSG